MGWEGRAEEDEEIAVDAELAIYMDNPSVSMSVEPAMKQAGNS